MLPASNTTADAQVIIASPAQGGVITAAAAGPLVTDATAAGAGVAIQAGGSLGTADTFVANGAIINVIGATPSVDALSLRSRAAPTDISFQITAASKLTTTSPGAAAVRVVGTASVTGMLTGGDQLFSGSTGVAITAASAANLVNGGAITGGVAGLAFDTPSAILDNAGSITSQSGNGVSASGGLRLENRLGAQIGGNGATGAGIVSTTLQLTNAGVIGGLDAAIRTSGATSVASSGNISSGQMTIAGVLVIGAGYGVALDAGGSITNSGLISAAAAAIVSHSNFSLVNTGDVTGGIIPASDSRLRDAVYADASSTILNAGRITGTVQAAVNLAAGGQVINTSGGTLTGGVDAALGLGVRLGAAATFDNYGAVSGAAGGLRQVANAQTIVNLFAGSSIGGIVLAGGNDNVSLYSGAGASAMAVVDAATGLTLQSAGPKAAASFSTIDLGGGVNTLNLRGQGDGSVANGATAILVQQNIAGATVYNKWDSGQWTLSGARTGGAGWNILGGTLALTGALTTDTGPAAILAGPGAALTIAGGASIATSDPGGVSAVRTDQSGGSITVATGGSVSGTGVGVQLAAGGALINRGTVQGTAVAGVTTAGVASIDNNGLLSGVGAGATGLSTSGGALALVNRAGGTITAPRVGLEASGSITIVNAGAIRGAGAEGVTGDKQGALGVSDILNGLSGVVSSAGAEAIALGGARANVRNYGTIAGGAGLAITAAPTAGATIDLYAGSRTGAIRTGAGDDRVRLYTGTGSAFAGVSYDTNSATLVNGASVGDVAIQASGANDQAQFGHIDLGAGRNILELRGQGDGSLSGGVVGRVDLAQVANASVLEKQESGVWILAGGPVQPGDPARSAIVNIRAGVLRLGLADRLADTAQLAILPGATLDLAGFSQTVGTLDGSGQISLGAGVLIVGGTGADFAYAGAVSGTGDIVKQGGGAFRLNGPQALTGKLDVVAGVLQFNGASAGGALIRGGTLTGDAAFAGQLAMSSGNLLPGTSDNLFGVVSAGTMSIGGGEVALVLGGASTGFSSNRLAAAGSVNLSGGAVAARATTGASDYRVAQTYAVLTAGALSGQFANGATFGSAGVDELFWRLRYDLAPNAVMLELRRQYDFTTALTASATGNQRAVATALGTGILEASDAYVAALNTIVATSGAERMKTYASLAGEPIANSASAALIGVGAFGDLLSRRAASRSDVDPAGTCVNQTLRHETCQTSGSGTWLQAYGGDTRFASSTSAQAFKVSVQGLAAGVEFSDHRMILGMAGAFGGGDTRQPASVADGGIGSGAIGAYAAYDSGLFQTQVTSAYQHNRITEARSIFIGDTPLARAKGSAGIDAWLVGAAASRRFSLGAGWLLTPKLGGRIFGATQEASNEQGALLALAAEASQRRLREAMAGVQVAHFGWVAGHEITPFFGMYGRRLWGDRSGFANVRFTGAPDAAARFPVTGAVMPRWAALMEGGVTAKIHGRISVALSSQALWSRQQRSAGVNMAVRHDF